MMSFVPIEGESHDEFTERLKSHLVDVQRRVTNIYCSKDNIICKNGEFFVRVCVLDGEGPQ